MASYVEYRANNSGGSWWVSDGGWRALEAAGWKVHWANLECLYDDEGSFVREADGTPKLVPEGQGNGRFANLFRTSDGRYLGALAREAWKPGATSIREAAAEWEQLTGCSATDAGCPCCGQPHNFTLYVDGKYVESGPEVSYSASW